MLEVRRAQVFQLRVCQLLQRPFSASLFEETSSTQMIKFSVIEFLKANGLQLHKSLSSGGFSVGIFQRKESNTYRLVGSAGGRSRVRSGQTSKRSSLIQQVGEVSFGCIGTVVNNLVAAWGHEQGIFDHLTMITRYLTISPVQGHVSRSGVLGSAGCQSSFD